MGRSRVYKIWLFPKFDLFKKHVFITKYVYLVYEILMLILNEKQFHIKYFPSNCLNVILIHIFCILIILLIIVCVFTFVGILMTMYLLIYMRQFFVFVTFMLYFLFCFFYFQKWETFIWVWYWNYRCLFVLYVFNVIW